MGTYHRLPSGAPMTSTLREKALAAKEATHELPEGEKVWLDYEGDKVIINSLGETASKSVLAKADYLAAVVDPDVILDLLTRLEAAEKERDQHKEMHEYFQKDALELSNEIEAMTGLSADAKRYWFDRAWAGFMKMPDDFRSKLSIHQVRELFRIMFVTRPANRPDDPPSAPIAALSAGGEKK